MSAAEPDGTDRPETGPRSAGPVRPAVELAGLASLALAVLFYMGSAHTGAYYGYFHVNTSGLGLGVADLAVRGIQLLSPFAILVAAVSLVLVTSGRGLSAWAARFRWWGWIHGRLDPPPPWLRRGTGLALMAAGLALYVLAHHAAVPITVVAVLLGAGPLVTAWTVRDDRAGRLAFAGALVLAALCVLWAASLRAERLGEAAAREFAADLPKRTAAVVYSEERLGFSDNAGVTAVPLPTGSRYRYRYEGLRLLAVRDGRYHLLPVGWRPELHPTYVLRDEDDLRIELYAGVRPAR